MDGVGNMPQQGRGQVGGERVEEFVLRSRAGALESLRSMIDEQGKLALVTGEAGSGKSWLCQRLQAVASQGRCWVGVDLSPANDPADVHRLIAHALGLHLTEGAAACRQRVADFLRESALEGRRWMLVVDEAHTASDAVLEELRILANRLGQGDGFAGMLLVGQTALARRLSTPALAGLASRIAARVHLRPLDIEDAAILLARLMPGLRWGQDSLERAHRDSRGNAALLIQAARNAGPRPALPVPGRSEPSLPAMIVEDSEPSERDLPLLGPTKPPIRVEDGLIEVGWEPSAERSTAADSEEAPIGDAIPVQQAEAEELVEDHYAALQAWNEWAKNQGRGTTATSPSRSRTAELASSAAAEFDLDLPRESSPTDSRPEGQPGYGSFHQLFSRFTDQNDET